MLLSIKRSHEFLFTFKHRILIDLSCFHWYIIKANSKKWLLQDCTVSCKLLASYSLNDLKWRKLFTSYSKYIQWHWINVKQKHLLLSKTNKEIITLLHMDSSIFNKIQPYLIIEEKSNKISYKCELDLFRVFSGKNPYFNFNIHSKYKYLENSKKKGTKSDSFSK